MTTRTTLLYAMDSNGLYTVSTVTGTSNLIGPTGISNPGNRIGLAYDESNMILYANIANIGGSMELYTIDVTTGAATLVGSNGVDEIIDGLAWLDDCGVVTTIPTLSEWGLIALAGVLGLVGFMVIRRRKVTA